MIYTIMISITTCFFLLIIFYCIEQISLLHKKIDRKYDLINGDLEELKKDIERNKNIERFMPPEERGLIKRLCFRDKCNQPIWVREYEKFDSEYRPLLCPSCWYQVYLKRDTQKDIFKDKRDDLEILKDIFKEMEIRNPNMSEMLTKERASRVEEQQ